MRGQSFIVYVEEQMIFFLKKKQQLYFNSEQ